MSSVKEEAPMTAITDALKTQICMFPESLSSVPPDQRRAFFAANDVRPERGEFVGDGVPRTFGGQPFEPLSWGHTLVFGRGGAR